MRVRRQMSHEWWKSPDVVVTCTSKTPKMRTALNSTRKALNALNNMKWPFLKVACYSYSIPWDLFLLYLVHSMAAHPPCETCCLWLAAGRRRRWSRTHARSVSGHSWPPAEGTEKIKEKPLVEVHIITSSSNDPQNKWRAGFCRLNKSLNFLDYIVFLQL